MVPVAMNGDLSTRAVLFVSFLYFYFYFYPYFLINNQILIDFKGRDCGPTGRDCGPTGRDCGPTGRDCGHRGVDRGRPSLYSFPMPQHRPKTTDAIRSFRNHPDAIVQAGEVVEMRFPSGGKMSLRGGKLFHLLIQIAGVRITDQVQHKVTLAALNETFHSSVSELEALVEELHTTTLRLHLTDSNGRRFTKSGPLLSDVEREDEDQTQAELRFEFSPAMRRAIANSTHWAVISRRAVMAFESRYALRLYTLLGLRAGLRKVSEEFSIEDLRELLGVPAGKLARWQDLKKWAIEPAVEEVSHLSGLKVMYMPIRRGRRIVGINLTWGVKDETGRVEAMKELERPKVGRKARRTGTVEAVEVVERAQLAEDLAAGVVDEDL